MKFCKDCKHYQVENYHDCNVAVKKFIKQDIVTGEWDIDDLKDWMATYQRHNPERCGKEGKWFEEKVPWHKQLFARFKQ